MSNQGVPEMEPSAKDRVHEVQIFNDATVVAARWFVRVDDARKIVEQAYADGYAAGRASMEHEWSRSRTHTPDSIEPGRAETTHVFTHNDLLQLLHAANLATKNVREQEMAGEQIPDGLMEMILHRSGSLGDTALVSPMTRLAIHYRGEIEAARREQLEADCAVLDKLWSPTPYARIAIEAINTAFEMKVAEDGKP